MKKKGYLQQKEMKFTPTLFGDILRPINLIFFLGFDLFLFISFYFLHLRFELSSSIFQLKDDSLKLPNLRNCSFITVPFFEKVKRYKTELTITKLFVGKATHIEFSKTISSYNESAWFLVENLFLRFKYVKSNYQLKNEIVYSDFLI